MFIVKHIITGQLLTVYKIKESPLGVLLFLSYLTHADKRRGWYWVEASQCEPVSYDTLYENNMNRIDYIKEMGLKSPEDNYESK